MRNFENKQKIMRVSGILKIVSGLIMAACFLGGVAGTVTTIGWDSESIRNQYTIADFYIIPWCAIGFMVWGNFWIFFRRLKNGHIFDAPTVGRLAAAGKWKLVGWIYMCTMIVAFNSKDSHNWLSQLGSLTGALAIIFVAWLLREGQMLEEEQELTV